VIGYQNLPTALTQPPMISHHTVGGPIIADDFILAPNTGGQVTRVEWWGSQPADNNWELVFQTDLAGQPNTDSASQGGFALFFPNVVGVADNPIPGVLHFTADLVGGPLLTSGTDYWLTIGNFADNWNWAEATSGPTVGSELYNAHFSVGGTPCTNAGPHCGPWTDIHTDFAFRISTVPEPASIVLTLLGLALAIPFGRRAARLSR